MNITDFCNGINFSNTSPLDSPRMEDNPDPIKLSGAAQFINEYLTTTTFVKMQHLLPLAPIHKMSTFAIGSIINFIANKLGTDSYYLNIGTWYGFSLCAGLIDTDTHCIGVDNFSEFGGPKEECYKWFEKFRRDDLGSELIEMDYVKFLQSVAPELFKFRKVGFYFYDGNHSYENQLKALELAEPFLNDEAYIMVDDINWDQPFKATMDFISKRRNYKIIFHQPTKANEYGQHHTFWNGIMVIKKG